MQLKNRKTGIIGRLFFEPDKEYHFTVETEDPSDMMIYKTLATLYADWEDVSEEPKEFWERGNAKKCVICGKTFVSRCAKRKTCSQACYYKLWRREHSCQDKKKLLKRCPICGAPCQSLKQTYCSKKCKSEAKHLRRPDLYKSNKFAGEVRACPICSATFLAGVRNKKYCSKKCYIKANNLKAGLRERKD